MLHMKKIEKLIFIFIGITFFASCSSEPEKVTPVKVIPSPDFTSSATIIKTMGTGVNIGNTYELAAQNTDPKTIFPIIDMYYSAGMRHIRLPITWRDKFSGNTLADENGNIDFNHPRFLQIKSVIDYAINKNMFIVINTHHEEWLYKNYNGTSNYDNIFKNIWTGIASHFKDYSPLLIFETLNEPQGVFGDYNGGADPYSKLALDYTRRINKVAYDAIRQTGGNNAKRLVMVSVNGQGNHYQFSAVYPDVASLPGEGNDPFLAAHLHTYDPWAFCGQTGKNSAYSGATEILKGLQATSSHALKLKIPVNYGEWGVGRESQTERNSDIVREYYKTMRSGCLSLNMAPTAWEDRGWFGLLTSNGSGGYSFQHNIVPTMMGIK